MEPEEQGEEPHLIRGGDWESGDIETKGRRGAEKPGEFTCREGRQLPPGSLTRRCQDSPSAKFLTHFTHPLLL